MKSLRMLLLSLQSAADRQGVTFCESSQLLDLLFIAPAVEVAGRHLYVDGHHGWMTAYAPGDVMVDFGSYLELRLSREPELDRFACDDEAEGVF